MIKMSSILNFSKLFSVNETIFMFEDQYDHEYFQNLMSNYWIYSFYISIIYLIFIFSGQYLMSSRPPFDLKYPLAFWNMFLAIFATLGFIRIFPEFYVVYKNHGFYGSVSLTSFLTNFNKSLNCFSLRYVNMAQLTKE